MAEDYIPKASGESYLKRAVNKHNAIKRKFEDQGKPFSANIVSIPLEQAEEIVIKYKARVPSVASLEKILEELQIQVNGGYESYSPSSLRTLVSRAIFHLNKIK
jgi:hypothetical protein